MLYLVTLIGFSVKHRDLVSDEDHTYQILNQNCNQKIFFVTLCSVYSLQV